MRTDSVAFAPSDAPWWPHEDVRPVCHSVPEWRSIVMDAYTCLPTLSLTAAQGQRLWGMDAPTCVDVLACLVVDGLLTRTSDGQYRRTDAVAPLSPGRAF